MDLIQDSFVSFVNLDHRTDRLNHMKGQFEKVGLQAERTPGLSPNLFPDAKYSVMRNRTPGAIGCHMAQVSIMKRALEMGKHAWVMEDDIIFCSDFDKRLEYMERFAQDEGWDVLWLGAAFHVVPYWHPHGPSGMRPNCSANLGKDVERTKYSHMVRTYGAYNTFAYIVNKDSIQKILDLFDEHIHTSIGIDWLFIKLQPQLKCFSFVPGCIYQMDNMSDIGNGMTVWSGHLRNGPYVWKNTMEEFNPDDFNWTP